MPDRRLAPATTPSAVIRWLLPAALAIGLFLRFWSLGFGLPELVHTDENLHVTHRLVPLMEPGPDRLYALKNPYGFTNLLYVLTRLGYAGLAVMGWIEADYWPSMQQAWESGGRSFFLLARATSAVLGAATAWLVFLAARDLFSCRRVAAIAALLFAVGFLHVRDSHFGTNDVTAMFFLAAAFRYAVRVYRGGGWSDYALAGATSGLAVGVKYNTLLIAVPLLLAHFLRQDGGRTFRRQGLVLLAAVTAAAAFVVANPQVLWHADAYWRGLMSLRQQAVAGPHVGQDQLAPWLLFLRWLPLSIGWATSAFLPAAVVLLWRSGRRTLLLASSLPVAYFVLTLGVEYFMLRFLLPLMPFLAIIAAAGVVRLVDLLAPDGARLATVLAVLALVIEPLAASVRLDLVLGRKDTRLLARSWIEQNLPEGSRVHLEGYGPRTRLAARSYVGTSRFEIVRAPAGTDLRHYVANDVRYYVLSSWVGGRIDKYDERFFAQKKFYRDLREHGRQLARFSPYRSSDEAEFNLDEIYAPVRPFARRRPGPVIEILELDTTLPVELKPSYRYQADADEGWHIRRQDGRIFSPGNGLTGEIEAVKSTPRAIRIRGWALDSERLQAFQSVLIFERERLLTAIEWGAARRDVALRFKEVAGRPAFGVTLGRRFFGELRQDELRVVALALDRSTELEQPVLPSRSPGPRSEVTSRPARDLPAPQ